MEFTVAVLGSGSKGNACVIGCDGLNLMVDAGFSRRELLVRMDQSGIDPRSIHAVLLTHEHTDHVKGARVFCDEMNIPLYCAPRAAEYLRRQNHLPGRVTLFSPGDAFLVCGFEVASFPVRHDALDPVGFVISAGGRRVGIATDLGCVSGPVADCLADCDALLLEANYDLEMLRASNRPFDLKRRIMGLSGHLDNLDALNALPSLLSGRTRNLVFTHISRECNSYDLVERLAQRALDELNRLDITLQVARQEEPAPVLRF